MAGWLAGWRPAVISMSPGGSGADSSYAVPTGAATEAGVTLCYPAACEMVHEMVHGILAPN